MTHPQASSKKHDPKGGNCTHTAWVKNGRVFLSNDDDGYYQQDFKNREELQAFVDHLWQIADEAWPKQSDDLLERLRNAYQCCKSCGTTYGVYSVGCSSSRIGKCDVCDAQTWVTETRDYAYLITGIRRVETARKSAG
jgi:hypothetical protein